MSAGGLLVLGTSLQEGARIELQLRGRAGRQGDPGTTQLLFDVGDPLVTTHGMQSEYRILQGTIEPAVAFTDLWCLFLCLVFLPKWALQSDLTDAVANPIMRGVLHRL